MLEVESQDARDAAQKGGGPKGGKAGGEGAVNAPK